MKQSTRWRDLQAEFEAMLSDAADLSVRGIELIGVSYEDPSESSIAPDVENRFEELVSRAGIAAGGTLETGRETWLNLLREELRPRDHQHFPAYRCTNYAASSEKMEYQEIPVSQIDFPSDEVVAKIVKSFQSKCGGGRKLPLEVQFVADELERAAVIETKGQSYDWLKNRRQPFLPLLVEPGDGDRYAAIPGQHLVHAACVALKLETLWCAVREPGTEEEDEPWMVKQDEVIEQVYTASAKLCGWLRTKALARELATEEPVPPSGSEEQREATTEFVVESRLPALTAKERRAAVTAYIEEVFKKTGERITKSQIWRAAGYRSRASLEQWERGDSRSHGIVDERFRSLILVEKLHLQNPGLGATKNE